ncbi:MAG: sensor histidine kinase [Deltaproteobacteria bacterium]|nr:sensor histidine kinase [Deltaproteobacteria bacterium]
MVCAADPAWGSPTEAVQLQTGQGEYVLDGLVDVLEDPSGSLTIDQVSSPGIATRFQNFGPRPLNFGLSQSAYWLRLRVSNPTSHPDWFLFAGFRQLNRVDLYQPEPSRPFGFRLTRSGDWVAAANRPMAGASIVLPLAVPAGTSQTVYLRVESDSALLIPLTLYDQATLGKVRMQEWSLTGLYYGILLVMMVYNLFLFFTLRDRHYLAYVLAVGFFGLYQFTLNNIGFEFSRFLPPFWNDRAVLVAMYLALFFHLVFNREFLNTRHNAPRMDLVLKGLLGVCVVLGGLVFFIPFFLSNVATIFISPVVILLMLSVGWVVWRNGYGPARFYLMAELFLALGGVVFALMGMGLVPVLPLTMSSLMAGSSLEVVLFSMALVDRIHVIQREREGFLLEALQNRELAMANLNENRRLKEEILKREDIQNDLRVAKERAEETTRLKDRFVSLVAHDLRSPFISILGLLNIATPTADPETVELPKDTLETVGVRATGMLRMVDELLKLNRIQTGKLIPEKRLFRFSEINPHLHMLQEIAERKKVRFDNQVPKTLWMYGDPMLLGEVFQNLALNGIKFTPSGGTVTLSQKSDHPLVFSITDNGVGISKNNIPLLLSGTERMTTPGTAGETGSGLGLSLCHEIITAHAGALGAESVEGKGSTFFVTLPVHSPSVLIAAGSDPDRKWMVSALKNTPVRVMETRELREMKQWMEETIFHLVVCTGQLADADGLTALELLKGMPGLKGNNEKTHFLLMFQGADITPTLEEQAKLLGADDVLTLPMEEDEFMHRILLSII